MAEYGMIAAIPSQIPSIAQLVERWTVVGLVRHP